EKGERNSVIAVENIDAGEEILLENPVLVTPNWDSEIRCSNCFRESNIVCKKCDVFPMCAACENHDHFDCDFFQKAVGFSKNLLIENFSVFGPLKCLLLLENPEESSTASEILKLPSFLTERRNSDIWKEHE
uniref:SET domain-containing protein n=1 Tax=Megaselia scalaris TaxID=36166 RepID=T1GYM9_MEGSC